MPVAQQAERGSAAARHFDGVRTAFGRDFATTRTDFVTLLSPGVLNMNKKWLPRARLWRLILSQNTAGYWCASSTTALALVARDSEEVESLPETLLSRIVGMLKGLTDTATEAEVVSDNISGVSGVGARREHDDLDDLFDTLPGGASDDEMPPSQNDKRPRKLFDSSDDPIACSVGAIGRAMPAALAKLKASDPSSPVTLLRVWTTMCCIAVLERQNVSWVWGDGDLYDPTERCAAAYFLAAQGAF